MTTVRFESTLDEIQAVRVMFALDAVDEVSELAYGGLTGPSYAIIKFIKHELGFETLDEFEEFLDIQDDAPAKVRSALFSWYCAEVRHRMHRLNGRQ